MPGLSLFCQKPDDQSVFTGMGSLLVPTRDSFHFICLFQGIWISGSYRMDLGLQLGSGSSDGGFFSTMPVSGAASGSSGSGSCWFQGILDGRFFRIFWRLFEGSDRTVILQDRTVLLDQEAFCGILDRTGFFRIGGFRKDRIGFLEDVDRWIIQRDRI